MESSAEGVLTARCEFLGNTLIYDAPSGFDHDGGEMKCKFKVKFPDGNGCTCQLETKKKWLPTGENDDDDANGKRWYKPYYQIRRDDCGCMRITNCAGSRHCPGGENWPCDVTGNPDFHGCYYDAPSILLTVDSSQR